MNKQEMNLLNEIRLLIEERNALKADKEALIDELRRCVEACEYCDHQFNKPCDVQPGHEMDCVTCTDTCICRDCKGGINFKWAGRYTPGKHAAPEHPLPVGVQRAMEEDKARKRGEGNDEH